MIAKMGQHIEFLPRALQFRRITLLLSVISLFSLAHGQDTTRAMTYNFLLYGGTQSGCTPAGTTPRNPYINTIMNAARPDLICANEIGANALHAENILVNALKPINPHYERSDMKNPSNSNLVNFLFYNSAKWGIKQHLTINNNLRDAQFFRLYFKDANLGTTPDTTFLCIVCMHLKAGNTSSDANDRAGQAAQVMDYLNVNASGENVLVMGDMNVYGSSEAAYQSMVNYSNSSNRVNDPANKPGSWNGNSTFALYHTQSTRANASSDCGSGGGMDDRFDHILATNSIMNGTDGIDYVAGSHKAFGNDGQHFNKSINATPTNTAVSSAVANALYASSDHLPVIMDMVVAGTLANTQPAVWTGWEVEVLENPFESTVRLRIRNDGSVGANLHFTLSDLTGRKVFDFTQYHPAGTHEVEIPVEGAPAGLYLLDIVAPESGRVVKKLIKT